MQHIPQASRRNTMCLKEKHLMRHRQPLLVVRLLKVFTHILPKQHTQTHTHLKVGLSIEAGCGDVTGAFCTI